MHPYILAHSSQGDVAVHDLSAFVPKQNTIQAGNGSFDVPEQFSDPVV